MWLRGAAVAAIAIALVGCSTQSDVDEAKASATSMQSASAAESSSDASSRSAAAPPGASTGGDPVIVEEYKSEDDSNYYYKFSTPENAESCVITVRKPGNQDEAESAATCHRKDSQAAQSQACDEANATGASVAPSGARYSCGAVEGDFRTLEFGDTIEVHEFKCVSEESGVTCHFKQPGFKLSRDKVTLY
jgi:hypothetical protein